jgi:two-component system, NarL family, sensor histidine kinase UhpB
MNGELFSTISVETWVSVVFLAGAGLLLIWHGRQLRRSWETVRVLQQRLARFQVLVEKSSDGISLIDPEGVILYASPSTTRVMGYTPDELVGQDCLDLVHPEDRPRVQTRLRELVSHPERDVTVECRCLHRDSSWLWLFCTGNNRLDEPGVRALVVNFRDISARKKAEEELLASRARLQALSRQLITAQETERRKVARELHDEIGQVLTLVTINLQGLKSSCSEEAAGRIDESIATVGQAIEQVRDLSLTLRPPMLDDFGLASALRWYVDLQKQRIDFEVQLEAQTSGERLPGEVEAACFRVVQEALTNAARHAQPRHVWIDLTQSEEEAELTIRDDGIGFDLPEARRRALQGGSLGLLGMQERVELLGGSFSIETSPGQGTVVRARLPAQSSGSPEKEGEEREGA